jgi:3-oxoacyl-[acyl-carrier protein] reductase
MFDLTGKVALVTGGSRGLGRAIALAFAGRGADLAINYRGNAAAAEEALAEIRSLGRRAIAVQGDTSAGREACEAIVRAALDEFGAIDILVNNAGITRDNLIMRMDHEEWQSVIDTNLSGPFWMTRAIARPMLKARSGRIINMSSVAGRMGNIGQANYASAKSAAARDATLALTPLGYIGSAADVAAAAVYLASDEARYVTGQVIGVDGGIMMGS